MITLFLIRKHHDDVIKWKHFPRYWPFVRGIHLSPVNSPHKGQWRGALMSSLICAWINGWVNNREAADLRRHHTHYVTVMIIPASITHIKKHTDIIEISYYIKCSMQLSCQSICCHFYIISICHPRKDLHDTAPTSSIYTFASDSIWNYLWRLTWERLNDDTAISHNTVNIMATNGLAM